jgi:hypothetical protein
MHTTQTGMIIKSLKENALLEGRAAKYLRSLNILGTQEFASRLEESSFVKMKQAHDLKNQARLEDLTVYVVRMEKAVRKKGKMKIYTYWYASWRDEKKVKNVYIGSTREMSHEEATHKARKMKREALEVVSQRSELFGGLYPIGDPCGLDEKQ